MVAKFIVLALLFIGCCYASPLRLAAVYGPPLFVVPVLIQDLDDPQTTMDEATMYTPNDDSEIVENTTNPIDIKKRSAEENDRNEDYNDDDLETAAGTNVLRPLFVYRQQVAYRQRVREAIRRGRRI